MPTLTERARLLLLLVVLSNCGKNSNGSANELDSAEIEKDHTATNAAAEFRGAYLIGDGTWIISAAGDAGDAFEMRNAPGQDPYLLMLSGVEHDTVQVYTTDDHAITIKMYPGHRRGMYYESDEQWPVQWIGFHDEETEEEAAERVLRERAAEDELAYNTLNSYDGKYTLYTESEAAAGTLELTYKGDRTFNFKLELKVPDTCTGSASGEVLMDRTQHGFFQTDGCMLHFNFAGSWAESGMVVEIDQPEPCSLMSGECIFTGRYTQGTPAL